MKLYHTLMVALVFALAGCSHDTYDGDTEDVPVAHDRKPVIPQERIHASYRIKSHLPTDPLIMFSIGTGTGIDARHILTAAHVVCDIPGYHPEQLADSITVDIPNAKGQPDHTAVCHILKIDQHVDLAELSTDEDLPVFHVLDYGAFVAGASIYNIGCANAGSPYQVFYGHLLKEVEMYGHDDKGKVTMFETDYPVVGGTSGGGVYTYGGHFIGVVSLSNGKHSRFVRVDEVKVFLEGK